MTDSPDEDWFGTGEPTEASGIVGEYFTLRREAEADVLAMQMGDRSEFFDGMVDRFRRRKLQRVVVLS